MMCGLFVFVIVLLKSADEQSGQWTLSEIYTDHVHYHSVVLSFSTDDVSFVRVLMKSLDG